MQTDCLDIRYQHIIDSHDQWHSLWTPGQGEDVVRSCNALQFALGAGPHCSGASLVFLRQAVCTQNTILLARIRRDLGNVKVPMMSFPLSHVLSIPLVLENMAVNLCFLGIKYIYRDVAIIYRLSRDVWNVYDPGVYWGFAGTIIPGSKFEILMRSF